MHVHPLFLRNRNAPIHFGPDSTKNAEKTLNPPKCSRLTAPTSSHKYHKSPRISPPQRLPPVCNPSFWDLVQCHHTSLTSWHVFFLEWSACEGLYLQPDHGWEVKLRKKETNWNETFFGKIWFFPIILEWRKQVIQMVSPTINATRDSSNSPRRHCDTVWPCSAACLYLKLLSYGKDQFNINRQARKTNDT